MNVITDPVDQLNALCGIAWKLPDQERREIESIATTRRWTGSSPLAQRAAEEPSVRSVSQACAGGGVSGKSAALLQAEEAMRIASSHGQPPNQWQITVMLEWARRFPQGGFGGTRPIVCNCTDCGTGAVIFPGQTGKLPESQGYCICPRCSKPKVAANEASA